MILRPKLTKKQKELKNAFVDDKIEEILFGGGARWGKTYWISEIVNATCLSFPWIARIVGRREWDDLQKTSLNTILKVLYWHWLKKDIDYTINMQTKTMKYANWSRVYFVPLRDVPSDPEFNWLWWYEITYARVDEAQEVNRKAIDVIKSRFTEKIKEYDLVWKVVLTCNPDKWHLYTDFIKPQREGTIKSNRVFIQSLYTDNPFIDHDKYKQSLEWANQITRKRLLDGDRDYDETPGRLFEYDKILDLKTNAWISGRKYITCDPARHWEDKAIIRVREWLVEIDKTVYDKCDATMIEGKIKEYAKRYTIPMSQVIVDEDGMWWPIVDHLRCKWFTNNSRALNGENYRNLKTQCYFKLAQYVNDGKISIKTLNDDLIQELDVLVQVKQDKDWPLEIISKEEIKKKIGRSPDESDSVMMRMWFEYQSIMPDLSRFKNYDA